VLLGSPADARLFVERAMSRFGAQLETRKSLLLAHVDVLDTGLRERLAEHDLKGSVRLAAMEPAPSGTALLTRTHPLTASLAEALVEASLDPETLSGLGIGRVGAWPTAAVQQVTRLALLRIRFKLTVHARKERLLLAEEAALVAVQGTRIVAIGEEARERPTVPMTTIPAARAPSVTEPANRYFAVCCATVSANSALPTRPSGSGLRSLSPTASSAPR